jgi:uncharacterized phage protein (TIGR01671 family)
VRQIKFRAWHGESKVYCEGSTSNMFSWIDDGQPITLEQFTGLQDKDGGNIYEGDILQPCGYLKSEFGRCLVTFKKGMFCFEISKPFIASTSPLYRSLGRGKSASNQFTIIGNIKQNYDLLESVKCPL